MYQLLHQYTTSMYCIINVLYQCILYICINILYQLSLLYQCTALIIYNILCQCTVQHHPQLSSQNNVYRMQMSTSGRLLVWAIIKMTALALKFLLLTDFIIKMIIVCRHTTRLKKKLLFLHNISGSNIL